MRSIPVYEWLEPPTVTAKVDISWVRFDPSVLQHSGI
jgi:hypothetical protein